MVLINRDTVAHTSSTAMTAGANAEDSRSSCQGRGGGRGERGYRGKSSIDVSTICFCWCNYFSTVHTARVRINVGSGCAYEVLRSHGLGEILSSSCYGLTSRENKAPILSLQGIGQVTLCVVPGVMMVQVRDRATVALTLLGEATEAEEAASSGDLAGLIGRGGAEEAKGEGPPKVPENTT